MVTRMLVLEKKNNLTVNILLINQIFAQDEQRSIKMTTKQMCRI
jgi:hypothetical protein